MDLNWVINTSFSAAAADQSANTDDNNKIGILAFYLKNHPHVELYYS